MVHAGEQWGHDQNKWSDERRVSTTPPETDEGAGCVRIGIIGAITVGTLLLVVSQGCDSDKSLPDSPRVEYEQSYIETTPQYPEEINAPAAEPTDGYLAAQLPLSALVEFAPETVTG